MIGSILEFFGTRLTRDPEGDSAEAEERALRLATGALLVQVMRADFEVQAEERAQVVTALADTFELGQSEAEELFTLAEQEADQAISLYPFTQLLNEQLGRDERRHMVELMWRIVYADGIREKHEEYLVRKVAKLLHVSHADFVATRQAVEKSLRTH